MQSFSSPLQNQSAQNSIPEVSLGPSDSTEDASDIKDLTWAVLDELASNDQIDRLEQLLLSSPTNRQDFLEVIQMHASLLEHARDSSNRGE